jgi:hypothetical protein
MFLSFGCAGRGDVGTENDVVGVTPHAVEPVVAVEGPAFPDQAVVGILRKVVSGKVVWTKTLDAAPTLPANVGELLQSGKPDASGFVYRDVTGATTDDGVAVYEYQYVVRRPISFASSEQPKPAGQPAPPKAPVPKLSAEVETAMASEPSDKVVSLYITLAQPFTTSLRATKQISAVSLATAEEQLTERTSRIAARQQEATALQAAVSAELSVLGADDIGGFWTSNAVGAKLPLSRIAELAQHPDVGNVSLDAPIVGEHSWTGADMKASGGVNGGIYHDNGFTGQAYANNPGGRNMRLAVIGGGFQINHPGFLDCPGCGTRAVGMDCTSGSVCVPGAPAAGGHAQKVAGIAGGSIRQGQIPGYTAQQELEMSGMAEEPEMDLLAITDTSNSIKHAIEWAMYYGVDVLVSSAGLYSGVVCDGQVGSDIEGTIYQAQFLGMIVVSSAGNTYAGQGTCTVMGLGEAPSAFTVGALATSTGECAASNYSSCYIGSYSDRGGEDATVGGYNHPGALSLVSAVTDGCPLWYFNTTSGIEMNDVCGTSYSCPQVGGAGIMIKDWFLDHGYTSISTEGRLFVVMQAMTDRSYGSGWGTVGFNARWGGGRFQARYLDLASGDLAAPAGWETYSAVLVQGQDDSHPFSTTGAEPVGLQQFKSHMVFFEGDTSDMADIDLKVEDNNCMPPNTTFGVDSSFDVKSMVRVGSGAAGKAMCTNLHAWTIPGGGSRRAHVFTYYSANTNMR